MNDNFANNLKNQAFSGSMNNGSNKKLESTFSQHANFLSSNDKKHEEHEFLPKSKLDLLGSSKLERQPRRTWSLYSLSSVNPSHSLELGDARFPIFPERPSPRRAISFTDDGKRRQAKLLLVSLLENFCLLYDESPHRNRKLFLVICKTLSSMGIVDEEYIDELSGVRHSYIKAFKDLVQQASLAVEQEKMLRQERRAISLQSSPAGFLTPEEAEVSASLSLSSTPFSFSDFIRTKNLDDLLNLCESRYRTDFEEKSLLGKGGFGSVWMAQNKLNGITYAIKKIRLNDNFKSYERMLREIKNLARLEHNNIVRYYSSWIEYVDCSSRKNSRAGETSAPSKKTKVQPEAFNSPETSPQKTGFTDDSTKTVLPFECDTLGCEDSLPKGSMFYRPGDSNASYSSSDMNEDNSISGYGLPDTGLEKIQFTISDLDESSDSTSQHSFESSGLEIEFVDNPEEVASDKGVVSSRNPSEIWSVPVSSTPDPHPESPKTPLTLFIQMQLCGATLKDYLEWRNAGVCTPNLEDNTRTSSVGRKFTSKKVLFDEPMPLAIDPNANIRLFRSIVEGVKYIHYSGLIHRDLKPANIFLSLPNSNSNRQLPRSMPTTPTPSPPKSLVCPSSSSLPNVSTSCRDPSSRIPFHDFDELVPKIGDFGLATSFVDPESASECLASKTDSSRTTHVGTITYASPEQLANPPVIYNEKSDIYSLGIIFFELFFPFTTRMERAKVLKDLRRGVLPNDFVTKWPKEAAFVLWLMADDPELRPSADAILEFELINPPTRIQFELGHQLAQKNALVEELKEENRSLHEKVKALESQLASLSI